MSPETPEHPNGESVDENVDRILGDIADATPVAWDEETQRAPHLGQTLDNLRAIGDIFAAFRAAGESPPPPPERRGSVASMGASLGGYEPRLPSPPFRWGELEVIEEIGRGGFGAIFRAIDPTLEREVALKLLPVTARDATPPGLLEARRLARVRHPNVLTVHGAELHDGFVGIETDLIAGPSLAEHLTEQGRLSLRDTCLLGLDLCRALAAVHSAGLVHGDLKAANVMRDRGGSSLLVDFGSVRNLRESASEEDFSGTPLSLAPEVLRGSPPGPAADLYSLGALLHVAVTGHHPIETDTLAELRERHASGPPPPIASRAPSLPRNFCRIVDRALAPLEHRYSHAGEMERDLADLLLDRSRSLSDEAEILTAQPKHNLPHRLSRFVGRASFTELTQRAVRGHRLVTLTGVPGCGKTSLALEAARRLLAEFEEVWLVDLAPVPHADLLPQELVRACGIRELPGRSTLESIIAHFRKRQALILLDNCEHLLPGTSTIVRSLLESCPHLHTLATSREALALAGEQLVQLQPMETPHRSLGDGAELRRIESVELFLDRARAARADYVLEDTALPQIARLCRHLDGLPLSIEIAAALVGVAPLDEIERRIQAGITLPSEHRGTVDRHRSLRDLIGWSYQRMTEAEKSLFRSLAVFSGSWSLEAAETIGANPQVPATDILALLARLVAMSLVERDGRARYRMLPTLLLYARDRATEAGEMRELRRKHREYFRALAIDGGARIQGAEQPAWLSRLEADLENLRAAAFAFLEQEAELERGLDLVAALGHFWRLRGHFEEGSDLCRRFLQDARVVDALASDFAAAGGPSRRSVTSVLLIASDLAYRRGESQEARRLTTRALELSRILGDAASIATSLLKLGNLEKQAGRVLEARALYVQSVEHRRHAGDRAALASALINLGIADSMLGDAPSARISLLESLAIYQRLQQPWGIASISNSLGVLALTQNDLDDAERWFQESFDLYRKIEDDSGVGTAALNLGTLFRRKKEPARARLMWEEALACARRVGEPATRIRIILSLSYLDLDTGDLESARKNLCDCIAVARQTEDSVVLWSAFPALSLVAIRQGRIDEAFRFLGAAHLLHQELPPNVDETEQSGAAAEELRAAVGESEFDTRWEEALRTPLADVLSEITANSDPLNQSG